MTRHGLRGCRAGSLADDATVEAIHLFLASTRAILVAAQPDHSPGSLEQQSLPGTVDEHPNRRRRYRVALDGLARDPGLRVLAPVFNAPSCGSPANKETRSCP